MDYRGRITASLAAAACGLLAIAVHMAFGGHAAHPVRALLSFVVYLSAGLPAAWLLGRSYDRLRTRAAQDELTKAWNRQFVSEAFPKLLKQAARRRKKLSVSLVDINDFKIINDTFGHQAGDQTLQLIAQTLESCASKGEIVARWGGDEFVVVCPYARSRGAEPLAEQLGHALEQLSLRIGARVSASVGTAVFPDDGRTLQELLHAADGRMYGDKERQKAGAAQPDPVKLQA